MQTQVWTLPGWKGLNLQFLSYHSHGALHEWMETIAILFCFTLLTSSETRLNLFCVTSAQFALLNERLRCDLFPQRLTGFSQQEQTAVISDWPRFQIMSQRYLLCVFYVPFISFKLTFSFSYLWSARTGQEISFSSSQLHLCLMCPSPREQPYRWSPYLLPSQSIQQRNYRVDVK